MEVFQLHVFLSLRFPPSLPLPPPPSPFLFLSLSPPLPLPALTLSLSPAHMTPDAHTGLEQLAPQPTAAA